MTTLGGVGPEPSRARVPVYVAATSLLLVVLVLPVAGHMLPVVPGLTSAWMATLLVCDGLTAVLLVGRYRAGASARLLVLAGGYLWSAAMIVALSLAVPGVLSGHPPIADPDAVWWLWLTRHVVPPVLIAVALVPWPASWQPLDTAPVRGPVVIRFVVPILGLATAVALLGWLRPAWLPPIARVSETTSVGSELRPTVAVLVGLLSLLAVIAAALGAYRRRSRSGLENWALVAAVAFLGDVVLTLANEPTFSVAYFAARFLGLGAGVAVLLFMLRDIALLHRRTSEVATQLKDQNAELLEAQRLRDHLVAVVSHEMRTPLAGLQGYLELLSSDPDLLEGPTGRMLERSWLLTRRLTLLAEDLLAVAAIEHGEFVVIPETINLAHQLDECAATFPDLDLRISCPSDLMVHADTLRLQQVLTNLVRNAQKHGAEPITITCSSDIDHVTIRVADSGAGVPRDFVHRLFDRYAQGENHGSGGSGLGLSVVRDLVRAHGGSVRYALTDPAFVIELPQHANARPRGAGQAPVVPTRRPAPVADPEPEPGSDEPAAEQRALVFQQQPQ